MIATANLARVPMSCAWSHEHDARRAFALRGGLRSYRDDERGTDDARSTSMLVPPVSQFMTSHPWTIDEGASLASARKLMSAHRIHHLPVVDDAKLVGMVSDRDLRFVADLGADLRVRDVMTEHPYQVLGATALDEVVEKMSPEAYGSVIVISAAGEIEGIFTMVDACRALADVLHQAT